MTERVKQFGILALPDKLMRADLSRGALADPGGERFRTPGTYGKLVDDLVHAEPGTPERAVAQSRFVQQIGNLFDNKRSPQGISVVIDLFHAMLNKKETSEPS